MFWNAGKCDFETAKLPIGKEDVKVIRILLMLKFVVRCISQPKKTNPDGCIKQREFSFIKTSDRCLEVSNQTEWSL